MLACTADNQELQEHEQQEAVRAESVRSARAHAEEAQREADELRHQLNRLQVCTGTLSAGSSARKDQPNSEPSAEEVVPGPVLFLCGGCG
jgi:hypothetical protein